MFSLRSTRPLGSRSRLLTLFLAVCAAVGLSVGQLQAQGIETEKDAVVLFGSTSTCTKPAEVDYKKLRDATPEWQTIKSEGVDKDSARYSLLISEMNKRIKKHCKLIAQEKGVDCVVRTGDVSNANGLDVTDLTKSVLESLESDADDS